MNNIADPNENKKLTPVEKNISNECPAELKEVIKTEINKALGEIKEIEEKQQEIVEIVKREYYAGILPHPEHMGMFENLLPGATDRLFKIVEKQTDHRHKIDKIIANNTRRGQYFAFIICTLFLSAGFWLILNGTDVGWIISLVGSLIPLISLFLSKRNKKEEIK